MAHRHSRFAITVPGAALLALAVAATGCPGASDPGPEGGATASVRSAVTSAGWISTGQVTVPRDENSDVLTLALEGETLVIGDSPHGAVHVHTRDAGGAGQWGRARTLERAGALAGDQFGASVALSGDTLIVGAPGYPGGDGTGRIYVFRQDRGGVGTWGQVATWQIPNLARLGSRVALDGDTALVLEESSHVRGVAVLNRDQNGPDQWGWAATLRPPEGAPIPGLPQVALAGDRAFVLGGQACFVHARDYPKAGDWGQIAAIHWDGEYGPEALAARGDFLLLGYGDWRAEVRHRNQGGAEAWGVVTTLRVQDATEGGNFPMDVSLSERFAVVAYGGEADPTSNRLGAVHLFLAGTTDPSTWLPAGVIRNADARPFGKRAQTAGSVLAAATFQTYPSIAFPDEVFVHELGCAPEYSGDACTYRCDCDPAGPCRTVQCGPLTADGGCEYVPAEDGTACQDDDRCTVGGTCKAGACVGSQPMACNAPGPCRDAGWCNPSLGTCEYPARTDGSPCEDGNPWTTNERCQAGKCLPTAERCEYYTACCDGYHPIRVGEPCFDGDPCTQDDTCWGGLCVGEPRVCPEPAPCRGHGTCDPLTGRCSSPQLPLGAACDDGDPCTLWDHCNLYGNCIGQGSGCAPDGVVPPDQGADEGGGGGCASGPAPATPLAFLLLFAAALPLRFRRRRG